MPCVNLDLNFKNETRKTGRFLLILQGVSQIWHSEEESSSLTTENESLPPRLAPHTSLTQLPAPNETMKVKIPLEAVCSQEDKAGADSFLDPLQQAGAYNNCLFVGINYKRSGTLSHAIGLEVLKVSLPPPGTPVWPWSNDLTSLSLSSWTAPALQCCYENFTS